MMIRLAESLVEGGYLFLGHAEGIIPLPPLFASLAAGFVYQRVLGSGAPIANPAVRAGLVRHA
jgi:hypothetical protein